MNDELIDLKFNDIAISLREPLSALAQCIEQINELFNNSIKPVLQSAIELIKCFIKKLESVISEMIKSYGMFQLNIPNINISINDHNYIPQAPPIEEKSIKEIAIENYHYNIQRYKNYKLIKLIKAKFPTFVETLIFEILIYLIFKSLGMQ